MLGMVLRKLMEIHRNLSMMKQPSKDLRRENRRYDAQANNSSPTRRDAELHISVFALEW